MAAVTTAVMGNCGFTLAPCAAANKHLVIRNLQRAEDISAEAMEAGIKWGWTTFPEYLDSVDATPKALAYEAMAQNEILQIVVFAVFFAVALGAMPVSARAQAYPNRPITLVKAAPNNDDTVIPRAAAASRRRASESVGIVA